MEITYVKIGENEGKVTVNVVESDYTEKVNQNLKEIGRKKDIPGFRKGHISLETLKKRFGRMVKSDVLNDMVYHAVIDYIRDNKIEILGYPIPENIQEINLDDKDYLFNYELALAPELHVKIDKDVHLPWYTISVTDDMIKRQDDELRERFGKKVDSDTYGERALVKGSLVELNADGSVKEDGVKVEDSIVAPFLFKDSDEAKKFEGTKVGDTVVFNPWKTCEGNAAELKSMLHIDDDKAKDMHSDFALTIKEFVLHAPADHDQEFFDAVFGKDVVKTEEEYTEKIREMIAQALLPNSVNMFRHDAEEHLFKTYGGFTLPERLLKKIISADHKDTPKEEIDKMYEGSVDGIKWEVIEQAVAKKLDVKVTEEDVNNAARQEAVNMLHSYGMPNINDDIVNMVMGNLLNDEKSRRRMAQVAFINQLFGKIHEAVTLDNKTISLDEFREIANATKAENLPDPDEQAPVKEEE